MKKIKFLALLICAFSMVSFVACSDDEDENQNQNQTGQSSIDVNLLYGTWQYIADDGEGNMDSIMFTFEQSKTGTMFMSIESGDQEETDKINKERMRFTDIPFNWTLVDTKLTLTVTGIYAMAITKPLEATIKSITATTMTLIGISSFTEDDGEGEETEEEIEEEVVFTKVS